MDKEIPNPIKDSLYHLDNIKLPIKAFLSKNESYDGST